MEKDKEKKGLGSDSVFGTGENQSDIHVGEKGKKKIGQ